MLNNNITHPADKSKQSSVDTGKKSQNISESDSRLVSALEYAKKGWPVFPVKDNKLPAVKAWEQRATTDENQIRQWYKSISCNFGFCPGRAGIAVIDLDMNKKDKDGNAVNGKDSLTAFCGDHGETLPETYTVRTPSGGLHRYYKVPHEIRSKNGFLPAVDVKSSGGYVVAAGSVNANGGKYEVIRNVEVAQMPQWLLDLYGRQANAEAAKEKVTQPPADIIADTPDKIERAKGIINEWPTVAEGERNTNLYQMMRELNKAGISAEKAKELYEDYGVEKINLAPDTAEVPKTIDSAYKDMSDFGSESEEHGKNAINMFDALPPEDRNGEAAGATTDKDADWRAEHFLDFDDLFYGKPAPHLGFLVHNFIYAEYDLVVWGAAGGAGKTTLTNQLQLAFTQGGCFPLPQEGEDDNPSPGTIVSTQLYGKDIKAMFVATEEPHNAHHRRYEKQTKAYPVKNKGRRKLVNLMQKRLELFIKDPKAGKVKEGADWSKFTDNVVREGINLVIFDNASNLMPGNENDRNDVSAFCTLLRESLCNRGVKVIVLAHTNKIGELSGSTGWKTGATEVIMTRTKGVGENRRFKTVIDKDNAGPLEGTCFFTKFDKENGCHRLVSEDEYNAVESVAVDESELEEARRAIAKRLQEQADKQAKGVAKEDGVSEYALKRIPRGENISWSQGAIQNAIDNMLSDSEIEEVDVATKRTTKEDAGKTVKGYRLTTYTPPTI